MERVQSLINKLAEQAKGESSVAELLQTTELLLAELKGSTVADAFSVRDGVAVWLPAGFITSKTIDRATEPAPVKMAEPTLIQSAEPIIEAKPEQIETAPVIVAKQPPATPVYRVPTPPPQVKTAPDPEPVISVKEPVSPANETEQFFTFDVPDEEPAEEEVVVINPEPAPVAKVIPEPPKPEAKQEPPVQAKPFPQYPDAASLMKNIFPLAPEPAPPAKELNQLVVDPVVALNEKLMQKQVELAEVLAAGPRITDLRKAISINDKYQMINSLFRGDEDVFERSIRTLNNFGSLPEARFWMQRELVVKLGWNEKDEMVQHFYKLVSRRFS
ncbi:hypothetical protein BH10BAC3_BH10BAC3_27080 [soil metagenome]